ncbi:hypothetical protein SNE40_009891 [Patella caerulea]|uniref:FYVE-type domain-containing protein n=1 Tax=Patella caerulea TaxID=87958 RepID=A0AAN8JTD9_PATCE
MASGQCYGCGVGFSLFKKEHGCKNCGFAFCSKCLTKIIAVPKLNNAKHHVCNKCYDIITGKVDEKDVRSKYSPPEAYKKRMAALEEKEKNPTSATKKATHTNSNKNKAKYIGLSKADREIAERLDKLKEKPATEAKVTDTDIASRLSKLKGVDPSTVQPSHQHKFYHPPDRRSEQKQVDDLLDEICDEVEIDSHFPGPATDVQQRLDKLKGQAKPGDQDVENNLNKDSQARIKKFDKNINQAGASSNGDNLDMEEITRLVEQASKELEVDAHKAIEGLKKDKEIMERLNEIKKRKTNGENSDEVKEDNKMNIDVTEDDSDSENEEEAIKRLVTRYVEESKLDEEMGEDMSNSNNRTSKSSKKEAKRKTDVPDDYDDSDELPYCCMCTEDAIIRCIDCDMDLFCTACFKASHDEIDIKDHKTKKYTAPKGYKDL